MHERFDIFSGSQSNPMWLEAADGLNSAVARMEQRARKNPGHYFVYDADRQSVVASVFTDDYGVAETATAGPKGVGGKCKTETRQKITKQRSA